MSDSNELEIELTSAADGAPAVVFVRGDVDMANAHEISGVVSVVAGWAETKRVVVDLSAVDFMDSSGIAALMSCRRDLHAAEVGFEVVGARDAPLNVLERTGVLDCLSSQPGADDARSRERSRVDVGGRRSR